jgi:penicillin amidase
MGLAPAPGWDARYDWQGFIPFEQLPRRFNPPEGMIVTANQKIVGDDYPYFITSEWTVPYRYQRIRTLLEAEPHHTKDTFAAIQKDVVSLAVRDALPLLLAAQWRRTPHARRASARCSTRCANGTARCRPTGRSRWW